MLFRSETFPITFQTGMLSNALPKLENLKNVHCAMRWKDMYAFLRILEGVSHRLSGLSLVSVRRFRTRALNYRFGRSS